MVDVTIFLYLPLNTSLDDLAFVANWGDSVVGQVEENMILSGKNPRYIRHRVLPKMYRDESDSPQKTGLLSENENNKTTRHAWTDEWLIAKKKQQRLEREQKEMPSWVVQCTESSSDSDSDDLSATNTEDHSLDTTTSLMSSLSVSSSAKSESFVDSIKSAVEFHLPEQSIANSHKSVSSEEECESDSVYSDSNSVGSSRISKRSARSLNSFVSNFSSGTNTSTGSMANNKHVILSIAAGYNRDELKEVRQIVNDNRCALLPIGIGNPGMIGLGGYYIKDLGGITKIRENIVNRLTHLI
jgi:hypothetical protein